MGGEISSSIVDEVAGGSSSSWIVGGDLPKPWPELLFLADRDDETENGHGAMKAVVDDSDRRVRKKRLFMVQVLLSRVGGTDYYYY